MRKKSALRRFFGSLCILIAVAFTVYLSVIMTQRINAVVLKDSYIKIFKYELVICAAFLVLSIDIRFGIFTAMKSKALKFIGWVLRLALVLAVGLVLVLSAKICIGGMVKNKGSAGNAIVLGLALQNGQPTQDLLERVDIAAKYAYTYPYSKLILTGGNPNEEGKTEAAVMRDLLIERGVPEDQMILEDQATTMIENFRNAAQMVDPTFSIVLITSDYHMDRAVRTAQDAGFTYVMRRPAPSSQLEYGVNVMWEVIHELDRYKTRLGL